MGESAEINDRLYDELDAAQWEEGADPNIGHETKLEVRIPPFKSVMHPLTQEQITENLADDLAGASPEVLDTLANVVANIRTKIVDDLVVKQAEIKNIEDSNKNPETRLRLKALKQQLSLQQYRAALDVEYAREKVTQFEQAWKQRETNPELLQGLLREPTSRSDVAVFALQQTLAQNQDNPLVKKLSPATQTALMPSEIRNLLQNPTSAAMITDVDAHGENGAQLKKFAENFLGTAGKTGQLDATLQQVAELQKTTNFSERDRLTLQGQLLATTGLAAIVLKIDEKPFVQKILEALQPKVVADAKAMEAQKERVFDVAAKQTNEMELPPELRAMVTDLKLRIMRGGTKDPKINFLGKFVKAHGETEKPEEIKAAWEITQNLLLDGKDIPSAPSRLLKEAAGWNKQKDWKRSSDQNALLQNGQLQRIAQYELAVEAERYLKTNPHADTEKLSKEHTPVGYTTIDQVKQLKPEDLKHEGKLMSRIFSAEGLASITAMALGGSMLALNVLASVQSGEWDNPYIAAGLGLAYAGKKGLDSNLLDTLVHPENKEKNALDSVRFTRLSFLIDVYSNPQERALLKKIDFSRSGAMAFRALQKGESKGQSTLAKEKNAARKAGTEYTGPEPLKNEQGLFGAPKLQISPTEIAGQPDQKNNETDFSTLLLSEFQEKPDVVKAGVSDNPESNYHRYKAIEFLYDKNIPNANLDKLFVYAEKLQQLPKGTPR